MRNWTVGWVKERSKTQALKSQMRWLKYFNLVRLKIFQNRFNPYDNGRWNSWYVIPGATCDLHQMDWERNIIGSRKTRSFETCGKMHRTDTIVEVIKEILLQMNLKITNARGQCYDGAAQIKALISKCLYTHCYGHAINLSVKDACAKISCTL